MLIAFSVTPLGVGADVGEIVAEAVRVVRASGLPNRTDAMFTTIEGDDWEQVMGVVRQAVVAVQQRAPRVSLVLKADLRPGVTDALNAKVETIERVLDSSASPSAPDLDPRRTALILVDLMPRVIATPTAPYPGPEVLDRSLRLADALRAAGGTVVFVRAERPGVDEQPPGSELACPPQPTDLEIVKRTWGAFQDTGLDAALRARSIDTVVLAGIATNFGVESTGRSADEHGYRTIFVADAMTGLDAHAHAFAIDYVFPRLGEVTTTTELLPALTGSS